MKPQNPIHFNLNGKFFTETSLPVFCEEKLANKNTEYWERSMCNFIKEWLEPADYIWVNTSGTTGEPQKIRLKKEHLIHSATLSGEALKINNNDKALLCLSADYIAGKMMIVRAFVLGLKLIAVKPVGNPLAQLTEDIDFTAMVPLQLANTLSKKSESGKLKKIKTVLIGGSAIDEYLVQQIQHFPNTMYSTYGMTETCTHIALRKLNGADRDICYKILPGIQIEKDERSCLIIHAPNIADTKIITNDIVSLKNPDKFEVLGRYDDIINSGGIKFNPADIEKKIGSALTEPFCISSLPDPKLGEKIILLVESQNQNLASLHKLWQKLEDKLDNMELPKQIEFFYPFIRTQSGKIDRKAMQEIIQNKYGTDNFFR